MQKFYLFIYFHLLISPIFCQYPQVNFENFSVRQGLPEHATFCVFQDHNDFMWMGGDHGLYKYNGYDFVYYKYLPGCKNCRPLEGVFSIKEDKLGLLWILSEAGIAIFDPENENSMIVCPNKYDSLSANSFLTKDLIIDSQGNIWSTGQTGLIKLSWKEDIKSLVTKNTVFDYQIQDIFSIQSIQLSDQKYGPDNNVNSIYEDNHGNIWIGCVDGLYILKKGGQTFERMDKGANYGTQKAIKWITEILEINENEYLIAADNGLYQLTNVKMALRESIPDKSLLHFSCETIKGGQKCISLFLDRHNNLLMGSNKEIYIVKKDIKTGKFIFKSLFVNITDPENIGYTNYIRDIFQDRSGEIWMTSSVNGISKFNLSKAQFANYKHLVFNYFNSSDITPIYKDDRDNLWIGAFGGGLYKINSVDNKVTLFDLGNVRCLHEVSPGIFWIGLITGIIEFNTNSGKSRNPFLKSKISANLKDAVVLDILKDGNHLYIATIIGLFVYNQSNYQLYQYSYNSNNFYYNYYNSVVSLIKMKNGEIWAGVSNHGINKVEFDSKSGSISLKPIITQREISDLGINIDAAHIYEDSQGFFCIADNSGLNRMNHKTKKIQNYKLFENIEFPGIRTIVEDDSNNLWFGTNIGLCRFDLKTEKVKIFDKEDGVPITMHGLNSLYKDKGGRLYFGGIGGFYSFHPDSLKTNDSVPSIVITQLRLFNKPVKVDTLKNAILTKTIAYTKLIELKHNQNDLSFEFAALDYNQTFKNKYAYKMEGYQLDWVVTDAKNRLATYTNLAPGTYTFRVKGSNNDGIWNEYGTSLKIIIHPPWWATTIARVIYIIFFILFIGGLIRWRLLHVTKEKIELEKLVRIRTQQIEDQKEEILTQRDLLETKNHQILELDQVKNRFFTNISHEFRTPLSLIQSPVEELMDDPRRNDKDRRKLSMIHRNARRLLHLVNQLLDISKIDSSKMKIELVEGSIIKHLRAISGAFTSMAETKSIYYHCHFPAIDIITWFDPDKLEKIAVNLLSNAFKFTPNGGEIIFNVSCSNCDNLHEKQFLEFSVEDNGPGIQLESQQKIFDRFYQVEESIKTDGGGTGIGLSFAHDLVRLQHGEINVVSEAGKGSTFIVKLPLGKEHLKELEYVVIKTNEFIIHDDDHLNKYKEFKDREVKEIISKINSKKPFILIVEDNADIRSQLYDNLSQEYCIMETIDGMAGLKKAIEFMPDLILTDLMMPRMNGIELCRQLKNDERTSHIPIIMLTARVTVDDKISGLQTGADDYVPKPFHMTELKVRVANLIESRKKLRDRFSREVTLEPKDITITSVDEKFLKKAIEVVENHISDENFDLPELRKKMNMSRSTLFRKLYALTSQSPTEFIRIVRLKRAASLLKQHFGNVSEVALEVGFTNPSYFTKCFKKMYSVSPVDYMKEEQQA